MFSVMSMCPFKLSRLKWVAKWEVVFSEALHLFWYINTIAFGCATLKLCWENCPHPFAKRPWHKNIDELLIFISYGPIALYNKCFDCLAAFLLSCSLFCPSEPFKLSKHHWVVELENVFFRRFSFDLVDVCCCLGQPCLLTLPGKLPLQQPTNQTNWQMYYSSNEIIATALVKIVFGEREGTK
jgi:hypothetical protein